MKKFIMAIAVLLLLSGCGNSTEIPTEITESAQTEETFAETALKTETEARTETALTTTTASETSAEETAAELPETTGIEAIEEESILTGETKTVYDILMSNTDIIFADGVDGINLIDLDFDRKPELLVSKYWFDDGMDFYNYDDVNVYGIDLENGCLNYIDTVYTLKSENVLGLKFTDKLEPKWFLMSRKTIGSEERYDHSDYLVTLSGGKLCYEEIFGYRFVRFKEGSDGAIVDPYFMCERIDPEDAELAGLWCTDKSPNKWDIHENMVIQYCSDINTVYGLCSGWLSDGTNEPLEIDTDTAPHEIAKMTERFFSDHRSGSEPLDFDYSSFFYRTP